MAGTPELLYAVVGIGDYAAEKVSNVRKLVDRKSSTKLYDDLVTRGRTLSKRVGNSAATKRAVAQTSTARSHVKGAATSVGKAVRANARATRSAARKTAKAS